MIMICEPSGIVECTRPGQGMMDMKQAGFEATVLDASLAAPNELLESIGKKTFRRNPYTEVVEKPEALQKFMEAFLSCASREKLEFPIAIAPYLAADTKHTDLKDLLLRLAEETIRLSAKAGCKQVMVPPLVSVPVGADIWEENRKFYLALAETAKEADVMLLLCNQCKNIGGHLIRGNCSDGAVAAAWVDALNTAVEEERFGFCMDVGICNLCGQNMYDYIVALGNRLQAVIVRDNDGNHDTALLPFAAVNKGTSQTDWLNLFRGLRTIAFDGALILNFSDMAAAASPMVRPALMQYAKAVADYIKWQVEIEALLKKYPSRVLFGAGNMCRNYMKCYGDLYPPQYTCDNNPTLWGTDFCGLTIHNPEDLKSLDSETAIFICNVYYREIERQLRNMGVNNPIEYFNDEYMPTFHFNRMTPERKIEA